MSILLSFDVSTTCIGYSVFEFDKDKQNFKFISVNNIKPTKIGSIFEKLNKTKQQILEVINKYKPDEIVIENIIEFMAKKSSAKTIIALAVMNRTVGLIAYEYLQKDPHLLYVTSIRATIKPKNYIHKTLDKLDIPEVLENTYGIKYDKIYRKKRTGEKVLADETFDMSDAIAVGLAWIKKNVEPQEKKIKKKK